MFTRRLLSFKLSRRTGFSPRTCQILQVRTKKKHTMKLLDGFGSTVDSTIIMIELSGECKARPALVHRWISGFAILGLSADNVRISIYFSLALFILHL